MALRLSELVVCGELLNVRKNSVHGWLGLDGFDRPLSLQLTGNAAPDLAGRHIRFEVRRPLETNPSDSAESETARLERLNLSQLAWQQIGPTGVMTAARKVRVADCSPTELYARCKLDEPPPMKWKQCLYLEWFGQNGHVVVELVDPIIEFIGSDHGELGADSIDSNMEQPSDEQAPDQAGHGFSITSIQLNGDGDVEIRDETPYMDQAEDSPEAGHDSYRLIPDELQREFDARAREVDRNLTGDDESQVIRELELMDDLIERGPGEPLGLLFDDIVKLPRPDHLDDQQAEEAMKMLLARLALHGIAFDICEHFTPAGAYQLLVEHYCQEGFAYPELRGTQWVQHFSTSEYCDACEAEFDRDYKKHNGGDSI